MERGCECVERGGRDRCEHGPARWRRGRWSGCAGCAAAQTRDQRIDLAAEADAEGGVEQGGEQGEPVAMPPTMPAPSRKATAPTAAKVSPTPCANRSGATGSRSTVGLSRGATNAAKSWPYGLRRGPATAPIANTTACAVSSRPAARVETVESNSTRTRTPVVTHAAKRGPRTSTCWAGCVDVGVAIVGCSCGTNRLLTCRRGDAAGTGLGDSPITDGGRSERRWAKRRRQPSA